MLSFKRGKIWAFIFLSALL